MDIQYDEKIIHGAYTRKSSESEDRQIQSIPRQKDDLLELVERDNLTMNGDILEETKSAFVPGREVFKQLVKATHKGKINAWLCWHANRLSRNPIDAGEIIYLMDIGKLLYIKTPSRIYHNTPTDKMMLQIEFTMSKKDSDDKSNFVKSGLKKRYKNGLPNGKAPIGFLNDKSQEKGGRGWLVDEEAFEKLKLLFTRFLKKEDSINSITTYAQKILELRTPQCKKQGGLIVGRSLVHHILRNPIYAGFFYSKNENGKGRSLRLLNKSMPTIISEDEHIKILNILGEKTHAHMQQHQTPYSGVIQGADGNYIGADVKLQVICDCTKKFAYRNRDRCPACDLKIPFMQSPKYLSYTYYFNINRKRTEGLTARCIEEKKVDAFLIDFFNRHLKMSEPLLKWCKLHIEKMKQEGEENERIKIKSLERKTRSFEIKKERLKQLFLSGLIPENEFKEDLKKLGQSKEEHIQEIEGVKTSFDHLENFFKLMTNFDIFIKKADYEEKKESLWWACSNLIWDEEKLSILRVKWLDEYIQGRKNLLEKYKVFEPENIVVNKGLNDLFKVTCPTLLAWLDTLRKTMPNR